MIDKFYGKSYNKIWEKLSPDSSFIKIFSTKVTANPSEQVSGYCTFWEESYGANIKDDAGK